MVEIGLGFGRNGRSVAEEPGDERDSDRTLSGGGTSPVRRPLSPFHLGDKLGEVPQPLLLGRAVADVYRLRHHELKI